MDTEIISKVQFQDYFGKPSDKQSELVRSAVNAFIPQYCHRELLGDETNRTESFRITSSYQRTLLVKKPPIISLDSIQIGETGSTSVVDATSYDLESTIGLIRLISTLLLGNSRYVVTYKGGYETIPNDLRLAALSIMAREVSHASKGRFGMRGRAMQGNSVELFIEGLTNTEKAILDGYVIDRMD